MNRIKGETKIRPIEKGIVIDHIISGRALILNDLLGLNKLALGCNDRIAIGINFSSKQGIKDFIKIENFCLSDEQLSYVSLVSPNATINVIQEYEVVDKKKAEIPDTIGDIVICPDRFCITNHEQVSCKFTVTNKNPVTLKCRYCEGEFYGKLIRFKTSPQVGLLDDKV